MENTNENQENISQDTSQKTKKIREDIKILEKELKDIQSNCNHPEYKITNCPSETSSFSLKRVCMKCQKEIGYPSQQEIDNWAKG